MAVWVGVYGPAATPSSIIEILNREIQLSLREPVLVQRFEQLGYLPLSQGPAEFAEFTRSEVRKWAQVITAAKIEPE